MTTAKLTSLSAAPVTPAHILVVDDDRAHRALCAALLRREGYEVLEAADGAQAMEMIARAEPNVVIMDVRMPVLDGLSCTAKLKSDPSTSHIPIIMASAAGRGEDIVAGLEAGADEYITKPIDAKVFRLRVRSMVRLSHAHKELERTMSLLGEQNRDLGVILDLSFELNAASDINTVLQRSVAAATELTGCRSASLLLPDDNQRELRLAFGRESRGPLGDELAIPIGAGIAGRAYHAMHALVYENMERVCRERHPAEAALFPGAPALATPLCMSERTVGVLNLADRVGAEPFTPKLLAYVDMIANLAATSLHDIQSRCARDDAHESVVVALAKLAEHRDDDTGKHLDRVTQFCVTLAEELRRHSKFAAIIDDQYIGDLKLAVPLHDIGKVAVPDSILLKPGRLTAREMEIMRTHVEFGAETIRSVRIRAPRSPFLKMAEEICYSHHEWFDGHGYPEGLAGENIPLSARMTALADVYDALTTKRVYKPAMTHEKAFSIIVSASGTQFDPDVVQAFIDREKDFIRLAEGLSDTPDDTREDLDTLPTEASLASRR